MTPARAPKDNTRGGATPPRPTTELFTEVLPLSPKQRVVLDAIREYPSGASVTTLSKRLGMHTNTVRGHLDELVSHGAVHTTTAPAKGRGRPTMLFSARVPDNGLIAREYLSLIELMAEEIADSPVDHDAQIATARRLGTRWARRTVLARAEHRPNGAEVPLDELVQHLRQLGFDPTDQRATAGHEVPDDTRLISLRTCPFVAADVTPSPIICAIHEGFIAEYFHALGGVRARLLPLHPVGRCTLCVTEATARAAGAWA